MKSSGFAAGTRYTPVPDPLLGPLLEEVHDLAELKCTLRVVYLLYQRRGGTRCISERELLADPVLLKGVEGTAVSTGEAIRQGMRLAVKRGTFLTVSVQQDGTEQRVFFLNDDAGRRAAERVPVESAVSAETEDVVRAPEGPRPNIFALYEKNIGMLTPLLAEAMKEAELEYPQDWIEEAFRLAVGRNARNWRYIEAILRRWATEGRDDGEPGRHTAEAADQEGLREYLRRRGRLSGS